ncbi:MAG: M14 family zinc carboxypeptidase [Planctomycetaceae bacterium]
MFAAGFVVSLAQRGMADEPAKATRHRMSFPGQTAGREMEVATATAWVSWLRNRNYDIGGFLRTDSTLDVILRPGDSLQKLLDVGFVVLETEASVPLSGAERLLDPPPGYADPAAIDTFMNAVTASHPGISRKFVIGQSNEGRNILAMEISDNPGIAEDEPSILLNGLHHSREVVTPHVVMDAITYLTSEYAAGNPEVAQWVQNYKIFCVPMVNPDGSHRVHNVDDFHRKNMRAVCTGGGSPNPGVDLNRNYPYHWGSGAANCDRGTGSSGTACNDTYRGTGPASEPETLAMMGLAAAERFVIAVSYHSYGQFIDYPYACNDGNPDNRMPEHEMIDELMHGAASGISTSGGPLYDVYSPIAIGPVNGDDTSWYYANNGTYAIIIEVGTSFQPSFATGQTQVAHNRGGWRYLLERLSGPRIDVRVADHLTGLPLVARVELLDFTFDTGELPRNSDATFGRSRWLVTGNDTYALRVSKTGYQTRTLAVSVGTSPVNTLVLLIPEGTKLGDVEPDGDLDMMDYVPYHACLGVEPIPAACRIFDFDADERITLTDHQMVTELLAGP